VTGHAALALNEYFQSVWNAQLQRPVTRVLLNSVEVPTHVGAMPVGPAPVNAAAVQGVGTQHVQVARTAPLMKARPLPPAVGVVDVLERLSLLTAGQPSLPFAPEGLFEFRLILRKAIAAATTYVYIEDQAFMGREIMQWLNARLRAAPALKAILVWGPDPGDPGNIFLRASMAQLIDGVTSPAERVVFCEYGGATTHSKIFIIDDVWASVGTANCARRSLYTDGELSVSVLDEAAPSFAERLRRDLWAEHCGAAPGSSEAAALADLGQALGIWRAAWGTASLPPGLSLLSAFERKTIPFEYADPPVPGQWGTAFFEPFDSLKFLIGYDVADADSR
jgi:phosphatidylserine/phosphatidylglycerophosphate/cardiolipin synthase-like enzyme